MRTTALDVTSVLPQLSPAKTRKLRLLVSRVSHDIYEDMEEEKTGQEALLPRVLQFNNFPSCTWRTAPLFD